MKGIIDKERLKEIGRYLERQIIIHRNVENDTKWNNEELMIVDLFDNYVELICEINNLQKGNQQLKEQNEYLRRSVDRKEETIINLEQEKVPYTNEYVKHLEKQLQEKEYIINKAKELIKEMTYGGNEDYYMENFKTVLEILEKSDK